MKAIVDSEACTGCGLCPQICPEVFEMDDKNIAIVKVAPVPSGLADKVKESVESCPVSAITIED
jgi:ferredoxin